MPLHLGHNSDLLLPTLRLVLETVIPNDRLPGRTAHRSGQQVPYLILQPLVCRKTDGKQVVLFFEKVVKARCGKGGIPSLRSASYHGPHRRIDRQSLSIVGILVSGKSAEHRLPEHGRHRVLGVAPSAPVQKILSSGLGQTEDIIEFAIRDQPCVTGDPRTMKFQPQTAVKIRPQNAVFAFTQWIPLIFDFKSGLDLYLCDRSMIHYAISWSPFGKSGFIHFH